MTAEAQRWVGGLEGHDVERAATLLDALTEHGPALGGRLCKRIRHARHHNMKELRSIGGNMRILFAFDRDRRAIILVGGDKSGDWTGCTDGRSRLPTGCSTRTFATTEGRGHGGMADAPTQETVERGADGALPAGDRGRPARRWAAARRARRRRGIHQTVLADALDVSQPNVSRIEAQDDVYLSTLARYVAALGGDLEVRAVFGDESVPLIP